MPLTTSKQSEKYNLLFDQSKVQNKQNFITSEDNFVDDVWRSPGNLSKDEKIEIIQTRSKAPSEQREQAF